jgi:hypothetical protein
LGCAKPWFNNGQDNEDAVIANAIADKLTREGFNPKSDEYWDELDYRLSKRGVGNDDREQDDADYDDEQQSQSQQIKQTVERTVSRKGPPVNSGSSRGDLGSGKVSVRVDKAFIDALKDNGFWNNEEQRNRMIKAHLEAKKQNALGGR